MKRLAAYLLIVLAGCAPAAAPIPPPAPAPEPPAPAPIRYGATTDLNALLQDAFDDTRTVRVLYATNRKAGASPGCDNQAYGTEPGGQTAFGICSLNVPKRHQVGDFKVADNPRADPHAYYRVLGHTPLDSLGFARQVAEGRPDVLVFVHGFNVRFEEAVLRTAQIAYDLKFQGSVVLLSWPAGDRSGFLGGAFINRTYQNDGRNAAATVPAFRGYFELLAGLDRTSHVIVHSMGHQVVIPALAAAAADSTRPFIGELILNAPDIPVEEFVAAVPALRSLARRTTVYCSYNDNAIAASETYNANRRVGGCALIDGVDVVNVGEIDGGAMGVGGLGHGYYASRPILTDIHQVLLGVDAERRLFMRRSEINSTENFYLRR